MLATILTIFAIYEGIDLVKQLFGKKEAFRLLFLMHLKSACVPLQFHTAES